MKRFFITGTDTGIGKTYVTCHLLKKYNQQELKTVGLKPVAAGGEKIDGHFYNADALALQKISSCQFSYETINYFLLRNPIAPHIAAQKENKKITIAQLIQIYQPIMMSDMDVVLVEGIGGWAVPLNERETMADFVRALNIPVILVVGLRLGCLNHTLLTADNLMRSQVTVAGWIANVLDPDMLCLEENVAFLEKKLSFPLLDTVAHLP